jgi:dolichol kinase
MIEFRSVEQSYTTEILRKTIHLTSLLIPIIYYFIPKSTALAILVPLTLLFALSDLLRILHEPTGQLYEQFFGFLLRSHERLGRGRKLNGATWVLLSATLTLWIFPKVVFLTAFSILIVSDTSAALIGRRFGRHPFLKKTSEGALAFLLSALVVVLIAPKVGTGIEEYLIGAAAALVGAIVESGATGVDDNVSIPLSVGGTLWALYALVLPGLNVYSLDRLG